MDKCTMCAGGPDETNSEHERDFMGKIELLKVKFLFVQLCVQKKHF